MPLATLLLASLLAPQAARWEKPYQVLDLPKTVQEFTADLPQENEGRLWRDGDILKAVYHAKLSGVSLSGGIQESMTKFEGTDYWGAQFKYDKWDQAVVAYIFVPEPMGANFTFKINNWRGENAPDLAKPTAELKGTLAQKIFETPLLATKRRVRVYMPSTTETNLPFVVVADGQGVETYAKNLEPLIEGGKVRPVALIGIESGEYQGDRSQPFDSEKDLRGKEYLRAFDKKSFDNHLKWVMEEVLPWARSEFKLSSKREDAAVFGFSNGGSFACQAAARFPNVFGISMPFSAGVLPEDIKVDGPQARYFFVAGALESFSLRTKQSCEIVKKWGAETQYEEYVAGHDPAMWELGFLKVIQKAFPPR